MALKIGQLKQVIEKYQDDDEAVIEIDGELFDCIAYDDEFGGDFGKVKLLVIAPEETEEEI